MSRTGSSGDTAPEQVARLLALVPYLHQRGEVRLEDAARHFGTSTGQLVKDLRVLFLTGLPGGMPDDLIEVDLDALEGEGVVRVSNADYLDRPVRFSPSEATALVVALRSMLEGTDGETHEVVGRTLAKLESVTAREPDAPRLHVQGEDVAGSGWVPLVERAIEAGHQLRISYHVPSRDELSERVVDPRGVTRVEGALYLDAWCHLAGGDRIFRIDRIIEAEELLSPVEDRTVRPRDLTEGWSFADDTTRATLVLDPEADWVPEYYPVVATRPLADGRVEVDLDVADEAWLRRLVLRLAPHARVLAPEEFTHGLVSSAREALRHYEGPA